MADTKNNASGSSKDCCACSEKHKERSPEEYKDLINRLSRIEGQVRGIKAMVERGAYCPDILVQTSAVNFGKEMTKSSKNSSPPFRR